MLVFIVFYVNLCSNDSNLDGDVYFNNSDYAAALEHYNEFLMLNPHHVKTLYNRGRCYEELGFADKAAEDYDEVLDREPDNVKALVSLSKYYYNNGNFEATINLCESAIMLDQENYLAHFYKARACHKIGDILDALDSYNAVLGIKPDFGFAYFQRASLFISMGLSPFGCYDLQIADSLHVDGAREAYLQFCR